MSDTQIKWQPVVLILNKRMECDCGAIAIFVTGDIPEDEKHNLMEHVTPWCQDCYVKMQKEEREA